VYLLAEGVEGVAETLGDLLLPGAIDKDGVQGFVEALGLMSGLEEEKASGCVVHNGLGDVSHFGDESVPEDSETEASLRGRKGKATVPSQQKNRPKCCPAGPSQGRQAKETARRRRCLDKKRPHTEARMAPGNPGIRCLSCEEWVLWKSAFRAKEHCLFIYSRS
jgi:hypothetical protein